MEQNSLLENESIESNSGPVECLGLTFEDDEARREHFTKLLAEKLKDPEFRKIEGFPIGTDEAILELSDPPYYTACPNPWLNDFISLWENQKEASDEDYHREPFAADVSEGKNDPIYNAHSYHTKVPHKAIMRYILHYTNPGDIVFDGFCGSGMTGVAAQMCGDKTQVESLGYSVDKNNNIYEQITNVEGDSEKKLISKLGERKVVLNDLSPIATFMAVNFNTPKNQIALEEEAAAVLQELERECGHLYETRHNDGRTKGRIIYTIWSDVFLCNECSEEIIFWDSAVDTEKGIVNEKFPCKSCNALVSKKDAHRAFDINFDYQTKEPHKVSKQVPVLIIYTIEGTKKRLSKVPDKFDLELLEKIKSANIENWYPSNRLIEGKETRRNDPLGMTNVNHFYTHRNLYTLAALFSKIKTKELKYLFTGFVNGATKLNQFHLKNYVFGGGGFNPGPRKGTLYAPSISMEVPISSLFRDRLNTQLRAFRNYHRLNINNFAISTSACNKISVNQDNILDYIFIDPPFGSNLNYSELSCFWESWLKVLTNNKNEAIENPAQKKGPNEYRALMTECFKEAYRLLKPGRWMTVEFSNTKASVWNNIQSSLSEAGFIVGNVSALDKKQGGINSNVTQTAVKQDLVISAYKVSNKFEILFNNDSKEVAGVWDFIDNHLSFLPVVKTNNKSIIKVSERDPRILFDRLVSFYVRRGINVPISSFEFQEKLKLKYSERDGMFFLPDQVIEYDKSRSKLNQVAQLNIFVDDESSAIDWLREELKTKPRTYSEIHPIFINELSGWKKNELQLELSTLLDQNFIKYDGKEDVPNQIHTYLSTNFKDMRGLAKDDPKLVAKAKDRWYVPDPNKAGDLEKVRLRALLREFEVYKAEKKKIKQPRAEALRAGFNHCWENQDLQTILDISAKIPPAVLQEDEKLLMFYDNAVTLTSNTDDDWD